MELLPDRRKPMTGTWSLFGSMTAGPGAAAGGLLDSTALALGAGEEE